MAYAIQSRHRGTRPSRRWTSVIGVAAFGPTVAITSGQVVRDGTLGPAGALPGPQVVVPASSGTTAGPNLFQSFSRFDVPAGGSVTFEGPDSTQNILARVTGGSPSSVNGRLVCPIPGANLYLINPDGVVFGPGASLQVRGSFAVTTADFVHLGADGRFEARTTVPSVLTTAAPAAFGFLGNAAGGAAAPGAITLERTGLGVPARQSLSIVGGDVSIRGGQLLAETGAINLAAAAGAGEVTLTPTPRGAVAAFAAGDAAPPGGAIEILDGTLVDASGPTPGVVTIRGGSLAVRGGDATSGQAALVVSDGTAGAPGAGDPGLAVDVELTGTGGAGGPLDVGPAGLLLARTTGPGDGGGVRIVAGRVTLDGGAGAEPERGVNGIATSSTAAGRAGDVHLAADALELVDGGDLASTAEGQGPGGNITVRAESLELTGGGQVFAQARAAGDGGNVDVSVGEAGRMTLAGRGSAILTSTTGPDAFGVSSTGNGGDITLQAGELEITDRAFVSSSTNGAGDAGDVVVNAGRIVLDGAGDTDEFTGIGANTQAGLNAPGGAGGSVTVNGGSVHIRDGAGIAARTFSSSGGGDVSLNLTGDLLIEAGPGVTTGLTAEAGPDPAELAQNPGAIVPLVDGGRINVRARRVEIRGGEINASATRSGGNVDIRADESVSLVDGRIVAAAPLEEFESRIDPGATLTGGNVTIGADTVVLNRGVLLANAREIGGVITVDTAGAFFPSADPETVLDASGGLAPGTVNTPPPDTDVAAKLLRLPGALADAAARLQALCGMRAGGNTSSFIATGRGGAPLTPGGFEPALTPVVRRAAPAEAADRSDGR